MTQTAASRNEPSRATEPAMINSCAALARPLISPHSQFAGLFLGIIESLAETAGVLPILVVKSEQEKATWARWTQHLGALEIRSNNIRYEPVENGTLVPEAVFSAARSYEKCLGIRINHLAVRDRHYGRGFAPGGANHPRSTMSEKTDYVAMVAAFVAELDFWFAIVETERPTSLINCNALAAIVARHFDIPFRFITGSRYLSYYYWSHDEYFGNPKFETAYKLQTKSPTSVKLDRPYEANVIFVSNFEKSISFSKLLKRSGKITAQRVYWKFKKYEKANGYYLVDQLKYMWRMRADYLRMVNKISKPFSVLDDKKFLFFPLNTEPEAALQAISPEFLYQLEAIIRIARELPVDTYLAVKDTAPAFGRRPNQFYDQIRDLKNVIIIDPRVRGVDLVNQSVGVATISGTSGFEAAIIGKPVIVFGAHNIYNCLPHVRFVETVSDLQEAVTEIFDQNIDFRSTELEGARFLEAVKAESFIMDKVDILNPTNVSRIHIDNALKGLLTSFEDAP